MSIAEPVRVAGADRLATAIQADFYYPQSAHAVVLARVAGTDRYDTAVKVASTFFPSGLFRLGLASGTSFADALASAIGALLLSSA